MQSAQEMNTRFQQLLELAGLLREVESVRGNLRPDEHVSVSLQRARDDAAKCQADVAKLNQKLLGLAQKVQDLVDPIDRARRTVEGLDEQLRPLVALISQRESMLEALGAELRTLASSSADDLLNRGDEVVRAKQTLVEFLKINRVTRDELKSERAIQASALYDLQHRLGEIQLETERVSNQLSKAEARLKQANERVVHWEQALSALHSQLDTMTERIAELQALGISVPE